MRCLRTVVLTTEMSPEDPCIVEVPQLSWTDAPAGVENRDALDAYYAENPNLPFKVYRDVPRVGKHLLAHGRAAWRATCRKVAAHLASPVVLVCGHYPTLGSMLRVAVRNNAELVEIVDNRVLDYCEAAVLTIKKGVVSKLEFVAS